MGSREQHSARSLSAIAGLAWLVQALYYGVTGVWPLVNIKTFQAVTGPKTDLWLVKTVGVLAGVLGAALGLAGHRGRITPEIKGMAIGSAASLATIDVVYVARRRISPIYLIDALANTLLIAGWLVAAPRHLRADRRARADAKLAQAQAERWRRQLPLTV